MSKILGRDRLSFPNIGWDRSSRFRTYLRPCTEQFVCWKSSPEIPNKKLLDHKKTQYEELLNFWHLEKINGVLFFGLYNCETFEGAPGEMSLMFFSLIRPFWDCQFFVIKYRIVTLTKRLLAAETFAINH